MSMSESTFRKLSLLSNYVYAVHYCYQRADVICVIIIPFFKKRKNINEKRNFSNSCQLCSVFAVQGSTLFIFTRHSKLDNYYYVKYAALFSTQPN